MISILPNQIGIGLGLIANVTDGTAVLATGERLIHLSSDGYMQTKVPDNAVDLFQQIADINIRRANDREIRHFMFIKIANWKDVFAPTDRKQLWLNWMLRDVKGKALVAAGPEQAQSSALVGGLDVFRYLEKRGVEVDYQVAREVATYALT